MRCMRCEAKCISPLADPFQAYITWNWQYIEDSQFQTCFCVNYSLRPNSRSNSRLVSS